jgi:hypothetical protein
MNPMHGPWISVATLGPLAGEYILTCKEPEKEGSSAFSRAYNKALFTGVEARDRIHIRDSGGTSLPRRLPTTRGPSVVRGGFINIQAKNPLLISDLGGKPHQYAFAWGHVRKHRHANETAVTKVRHNHGEGHVDVSDIRISAKSLMPHKRKIETCMRWAARQLNRRRTQIQAIDHDNNTWNVLNYSSSDKYADVTVHTKIPRRSVKNYEHVVVPILRRARAGKSTLEDLLTFAQVRGPKLFESIQLFGSEYSGRIFLLWNVPDRPAGGAVIAVLPPGEEFSRSHVQPRCLHDGLQLTKRGAAVLRRFRSASTSQKKRLLDKWANRTSRFLTRVTAIFVYGYVTQHYAMPRKFGQMGRISTNNRLYGWLLASIVGGSRFIPMLVRSSQQ